METTNNRKEENTTKENNLDTNLNDNNKTDCADYIINKSYTIDTDELSTNSDIYDIYTTTNDYNITANQKEIKKINLQIFEKQKKEEIFTQKKIFFIKKIQNLKKLKTTDISFLHQCTHTDNQWLHTLFIPYFSSIHTPHHLIEEKDILKYISNLNHLFHTPTTTSFFDTLFTQRLLFILQPLPLNTAYEILISIKDILTDKILFYLKESIFKEKLIKELKVIESSLCVDSTEGYNREECGKKGEKSSLCVDREVKNSSLCVDREGEDGFTNHKNSTTFWLFFRRFTDYGLEYIIEDLFKLLFRNNLLSLQILEEVMLLYNNKLKKCIFIEINNYISIYLSKDREMKNIKYFKEIFKSVACYSLYVCRTKRLKIYKIMFEFIILNIYRYLCDNKLEGSRLEGSKLDGFSDKSIKLEGVNHMSSKLEGVDRNGSSYKGVKHMSSELVGVKHISSELEGVNNNINYGKGVDESTNEHKGVKDSINTQHPVGNAKHPVNDKDCFNNSRILNNIHDDYLLDLYLTIRMYLPLEYKFLLTNILVVIKDYLDNKMENYGSEYYIEEYEFI